MHTSFDLRRTAVCLLAVFLLSTPVQAATQTLKDVTAAIYNPGAVPADASMLARAAQLAIGQQGWVLQTAGQPGRITLFKREGARSVTLAMTQDTAGYRLSYLASEGMGFARVVDNSAANEVMPSGCAYHCRRAWEESRKQLAQQVVYVEQVDDHYYRWVMPLARQLQLAGNAALAQTWADVFAANLLRSDGELITFAILDKAARAAAPRLGWQALPSMQPDTVNLTRSEGGRSATVQLTQRGQGFRLSYVASAGLGWSKRERQLEKMSYSGGCYGPCQQREAELYQQSREDGSLYEQRIDDTYYQWVRALRDEIAAESDRAQP